MILRYPFKTPHPLKIFCLTLGGHIAIPFITQEFLLLDRNLLAKIKNSSQLKNSAEIYWVGQFNQVARNINPILTAYEGCLTRQPTKEEFSAELSASRDALLKIYPTKNIVQHTTEFSAALFESLTRKLIRKNEEIIFLKEMAPLVAHRPSDKDLMPKLREIVARGREAGLTSESLVIPALLSCCAERKDGATLSPGRKVIGPKLEFTDRDAYNAISDLQYLDFLIASGTHTEGTVALCTTDLGLAEFWLALSPKAGIRNSENDIIFSYKLDKKLVPRLNNEQLAELRGLV